jgi:DNA-binding transcriptional regulator YiaG
MDARARAFLAEVRSGEPTTALSGRLGYRGDAVADWENGKKVPATEEILRFCRARGVDVFAAVTRFDPGSASALRDLDTEGVAAWARALCQRHEPRSLAHRMGAPPAMVRRWLGGQVRPSWPEFVGLVEAATGRSEDLLRELAPPSANTPAAAARARSEVGRRPAHAALWAARQLRENMGTPREVPPPPQPPPLALADLEESDDLTVETFGGDRTEPRIAPPPEATAPGVAPLLHRVWSAVASEDYANLGHERPGWLAARCSLPEEVVEGCLDVLCHEGQLLWAEDRHVVQVPPPGAVPELPPPDPVALLAARLEPVVLSVSRDDVRRIRALRRRSRSELAAIEASTRAREALILVIPDPDPPVS